MDPADYSQLAKLVCPFPSNVVKTNPSGGGSYVAHPVVEQRIIDALGHPPSTSLVEVLRGPVAGKPADPKGQSARARAGTPDLPAAVVGCVLRMEATVDGRPWYAEEAGDCESPHNWPHDGARLKDAMSDAYKRCLIAGTQVWTSAGPRPIELVRPGARVMTRQGLSLVVDAGLSDPDPQPVVKVEFTNGETLTGTPDHPVFVLGRGYLPLCEMSAGDRIYSCHDLPRPPASRSSTTASPSGATSAAATTSAGTGSPRRRSPSTEWSTPRLTDPSPLAGTSTTRTATRATTTPPTWRRSSPGSTPSTTVPRIAAPFVAATAAAASMSLAARGTSVGALWPARNASTATRGFGPWSASAPSAGAPTPALCPPTAAKHADASAPRSSATAASDLASSAASPSWRSGPGLGSAPVLVSSVRHVEPQRVWNLTVAGPNEYFANGVLTHNCAMRLGVALHLWAQDAFYLFDKLEKRDAAAAGAEP